MRRGLPVVMAVLAGLSAVLARPDGGGAATVRIAQADIGDRMGPVRSPNVVIEEPRPPSVVIETEGRRERADCRSVTITERKNGVEVTRTEHRCGR